MRALIIDDENKQREVIRQLLEKYCPDIQVCGEAADVPTAYELIQKEQPELVFLDVEMPGGSGFDLLTKFDRLDFEVVFVTGFGEYAVKAFEFNALHFIQKPIDDRNIVQAVAKARKRLSEKERSNHYEIILDNLKRPPQQQMDNQIAIPLFEGLEFLHVKDIIRCESDAGNTLIFSQTSKRIYSSKHLKEYQTILSDYNFFRIHHSHLINMSHIKKFLKEDGGTVIMSDGSSLPVARRRREGFLEALDEVLS